MREAAAGSSFNFAVHVCESIKQVVGILFGPDMISRFLVNLKLPLSVDYDYLLVDYYYGVVWRAS